MASTWRIFASAGLVTMLAASCSLVNSADDPVPPGTGGSGGTDPMGGGGTGGDDPECTGDGDCSSLDDECVQGVCDNGSCTTEPLAEGTACGDATESACDAADSCDAAGVCQTNNAADGTLCGDCPGGGTCGTCAAGACPDCTALADTLEFRRADAVDDWTLTGGWGLYTEAPISQSDQAPKKFRKRVLGTDGNRSKPYPGSELEMSAAESPVVEMPATLNFRSWNQDEGSNPYDTKRILISTDGGGSFTPIVDCNAAPPLGGHPFCDFVLDRDPTLWDEIQIPIPATAVGQMGVVRFEYDTVDSAGGFERGWFIDALNIDQECACEADADCAFMPDECGTPTCETSRGICSYTAPAADGTMCGDQMEEACSAANSCDGFGNCDPNHAVDTSICPDCPAGAGSCFGCAEGTCIDCPGTVPPINTFDNGLYIQKWTMTGGWGLYFSAPISPSDQVAVNFGNGVFGTDGNRLPPYSALGTEAEMSEAISPPFTMPAMLSFSSWHKDEGTTDRKRISVSTDGGMNWTPIVDCNVSGMNGYPFCQSFSGPRTASQWDPITVDTTAFMGMPALLRFEYDTQDACCSFERGWFIDNLNVAMVCLP